MHRLADFLYRDTRSAPLWLVVRLYVSYEWLVAGYEKVINPAWFGSGAGAALSGFVQGAFGKMAGAHPDVQGWYAAFLSHAVLPHLVLWSNLVTVGELLVGLGVLLGVLVGTASFFGAVMNMSFLLAGTVSINPLLLVCEFLLMNAHRVAATWGLERPLVRLYARLRRS